MSVINGFTIVLMILLLVYTLYRLFKKRNLLMLIPACAQIYALSFAILSFINNVEALPIVQGAYIILGMVPPALFLIIDYIRMIKNVRSKGVFEGLVKPVAKPVPATLCLPLEGINQLAPDKPLQEILKEIKSLPDEMQKSFKKCLNHAQMLYKQEDINSSFYIYDTLSKVVGSSSTLYYNTAGLCYELERYEEALACYKKAIELSDGSVLVQRDIYYNMGNTYFMLKQYESAAKCYEKAMDGSTGDTPTIENLAFTYVRMGEADKGIELLSSTTVEKDNYRAHFISGKLLHEAEKYDEAVIELNKCIKLKPNVIEAREELGRILIKQNKSEEAIGVFNEILRFEPENYSAWCNKANLCRKLNRWKEAVASYKEAVKIKPDSYKCFYNMAIALGETGDNQAAIEAFYNTLKIRPDFIDAYNNLGISLSLLGRYEDALEVYEEGIKRNPQDFSLFFNMGMSLFETGKFIGAAAAYRNALDIKPEELEVYYYLGAALTELRHYNDAIEAYKSALKIKPTDGELHYNIASIYAMLGRYDIAGENLDHAIKLNGDIREDVLQNKAFDGMRGRADFKEMVG